VRNRASIEATNKSMEQATDINTRDTAILTEPDTSTDRTLTDPSQIHSKKLNSKITIECKTEEIEEMPKVSESQSSQPPPPNLLLTSLGTSSLTQRTITVKRPIKKI